MAIEEMLFLSVGGRSKAVGLRHIVAADYFAPPTKEEVEQANLDGEPITNMVSVLVLTMAVAHMEPAETLELRFRGADADRMWDAIMRHTWAC